MVQFLEVHQHGVRIMLRVGACVVMIDVSCLTGEYTAALGAGIPGGCEARNAFSRQCKRSSPNALA